MKCPQCGRLDENTRVIDSRPFKHTIKRRRECSFCHHRWNTFEATEQEFYSDRNRNKYLSWSEGEENTAMLLAFDGVTRVKIAHILGRNRMSVSRKLDKLLNTDRYFAVVNEELNKQKKV
jgi:transcriptional regulator NrdR family protein